MPPSGRPRLARRALAEGFAAFALVFAGCGAIVTDARSGGSLGAAGVGLVFGLVIMVMVFATGHLSGAHINPAVTVAFALTRHFPARDAVAYIGAHLAWTAAGQLLLLAAWPSTPPTLGATSPAMSPGSAPPRIRTAEEADGTRPVRVPPQRRPLPDERGALQPGGRRPARRAVSRNHARRARPPRGRPGDERGRGRPRGTDSAEALARD